VGGDRRGRACLSVSAPLVSKRSHVEKSRTELRSMGAFAGWGGQPRHSVRIRQNRQTEAHHDEASARDEEGAEHARGVLRGAGGNAELSEAPSSAALAHAYPPRQHGRHKRDGRR
jgi:hypothetical protein